MDETKRRLESWNRFIIRNLVVEPNLLGQFHEFVLDDYIVRIQLPCSDKLTTQTAYPLEGVSVYSHRKIDGQEVPQSYFIHSVDASVSLPQPVRLPVDAVSGKSITRDCFSNEEQSYLDNVAKQCRRTAEDAYDLWVRTLRWKCDNSGIGRFEIQGPESGWDTYLIDKPTGNRIWSASIRLVITFHSAVTMEEWKATDMALRKGLRPPVYWDLKFDAAQHLYHGNPQRAVIDMAVACETYLRATVMQALPDCLGSTVRTCIDQANIRQYINKFFPEVLSELETRRYSKSLKSNLHKLFNLRNTILHSGPTGELKVEECRLLLDATNQLLTIRDVV